MPGLQNIITVDHHHHHHHGALPVTSLSPFSVPQFLSLELLKMIETSSKHILSNDGVDGGLPW